MHRLSIVWLVCECHVRHSKITALCASSCAATDVTQQFLPPNFLCPCTGSQPLFANARARARSHLVPVSSAIISTLQLLFESREMVIIFFAGCLENEAERNDENRHSQPKNQSKATRPSACTVMRGKLRICAHLFASGGEMPQIE